MHAWSACKPTENAAPDKWESDRLLILSHVERACKCGRRLQTAGKSCATGGGDSECISVNATRSVLTATRNAGGKHWREGIVVELNDEREHQVE
jgi:hypothetical protein